MAVEKAVENQEETKEVCDCPKCRQRVEEEKAQEELNLAILIALVPALTITLFSNMGIL